MTRVSNGSKNEDGTAGGAGFGGEDCTGGGAGGGAGAWDWGSGDVVWVGRLNGWVYLPVATK